MNRIKNNNNITVAHRFNKVADQFESIIDDYSVSRRHEIVLPLLCGKVLITGCGTKSFESKKSTLSLIYMDIAYNMCRMVKKKSHTAICGDAEMLPFSNHSLDHIVSLEMVYYLNQPNRFFNESYRTLKPGGLMMVSSFNQRLVWYDRIIRRLLRICSIGPHYFDDPVKRFFYKDELIKMMINHGFQIDCSRSLLIVPFRKMKFLDEQLEKTFFKHFAMFHMIIARKPHDTIIIN
jgi:ubiquinone/menaquinone biosynthesis C-methylase UbiE